MRCALADVPIDRKIVDRGYQIDCIETLSAQVAGGRRKLLVEMATGTGKTRTAVAFVKRLFEAGAVTPRPLSGRPDRAGHTWPRTPSPITLATIPCHVLRPGRGFDRAKRITIATLQTMIAEYRTLFVGLFRSSDHRRVPPARSTASGAAYCGISDGIQLGLTATPCTAGADESPDPRTGASCATRCASSSSDAPTFRYVLHRAIREGWLAPYRIYKAMTVKTANRGRLRGRARRARLVFNG